AGRAAVYLAGELEHPAFTAGAVAGAGGGNGHVAPSGQLQPSNSGIGLQNHRISALNLKGYLVHKIFSSRSKIATKRFIPLFRFFPRISPSGGTPASVETL